MDWKAYWKTRIKSSKTKKNMVKNLKMKNEKQIPIKKLDFGVALRGRSEKLIKKKHNPV